MICRVYGILPSDSVSLIIVVPLTMTCIISARMGGSGGKCPHIKNSVGATSSSYKYIKYFYIIRFVNSYQQLSPISVETVFA